MLKKTNLLFMNDVWININALEINSIGVNSNTEWTHLKISDNSNIFGEGEIFRVNGMFANYDNALYE